MNNSSFFAKPRSNAIDMDFAVLLVWCITNGLMAFCAVFGNALVMIAFVRFKKLRTRTNFFIFGLSVADILVGLISVPFWMATMITIWLKSTAWTSSTIYRAYIALDAFAGISSILHLMLISLERMYAIGWPINHRVSSRNSYLLVLAFAWFLALGTFSLFLPKKEISIIPRFYVLFILFFVPLLVIVIAYVAIYWIVRNNQHDTNYWTQNREVKLASILFLVSVLFIAAWTPFMVINIVIFLCHECPIKPRLIYFIKLLHYSNSAVNPILYSYRMTEFKRAFLAILRGQVWPHRTRDISFRSSFDTRNASSRTSSGKKSSSLRGHVNDKRLLNQAVDV